MVFSCVMTHELCLGKHLPKFCMIPSKFQIFWMSNWCIVINLWQILSTIAKENSTRISQWLTEISVTDFIVPPLCKLVSLTLILISDTICSLVTLNTLKGVHSCEKLRTWPGPLISLRMGVLGCHKAAALRQLLHQK